MDKLKAWLTLHWHSFGGGLAIGFLVGFIVGKL